jgi:glycosyltransferase involved in cell wall biosynthesis
VTSGGSCSNIFIFLLFSRSYLIGVLKLNILHTIQGITFQSGGTANAVTNLCERLGSEENRTKLLVVGDIRDSGKWVLPNPQVVKLKCATERKIPFVNVGYSPEYGNSIKYIHLSERLDIIHDNGLWLPSNKASAETAKFLKIPLVISPHGMLEPWAIKYKGCKKKIAWWIWQERAVKNAAMLHATAKEEADNLRALGLENPIAIIPNGVDVPDRYAMHEEKKERNVLFLSRVHPIKGILNLVSAWAKIKPKGWKLLIAGPDEGGHQVEVQRMVDAYSLADQVIFAGPVAAAAKWDLFAQSSLFVLPSFSENFGIVVAEALATGVPVITTKGTPWSELVKHECGWWVDADEGGVESALRIGMALSDTERLEMGQRGRKLVQNNYAWPQVADKMKSAYRWVLERGTPPDCIRIG